MKEKSTHLLSVFALIMQIFFSQTLKRDWELESDMHLKNMVEELSAKHQTEMVELQKTLEMELEKVKTELGVLSLENEQSKIKCVELEEQHELAITELQQQLQAEHNQLLENMKMKSQEKEENLQKELEKLQVMHEELKTRSQEEVRHLWSQLDSTRANRQELSGRSKTEALPFLPLLHIEVHIFDTKYLYSCTRTHR